MKTPLLILLAVFAILGSPSAWADDMIIGGKHCNSACQSWLGIVPAGAITPAVRAVEPTPQRAASLEPPSRTIPLALPPRRAATLEAAPPVPFSPTRRPTARRQAYAPVPKTERVGTPEAVIEDSPSDGAPVPAVRDERARSRPRSRAPGKRIGGDPVMEPGGLTGIPKLSSLVAVRGAIIDETPREKADRMRQFAAMQRETSRPHITMGGIPAGRPSIASGLQTNAR